MAKNNDPATEVATTETPATENAADKRAIVLTLKDGSTEKRADYIRRRWGEKNATRSQIAAELSELQGKKVPYQIVFQATKGVEGGPPAQTESSSPAVAEGVSA